MLLRAGNGGAPRFDITRTSWERAWAGPWLVDERQQLETMCARHGRDGEDSACSSACAAVSRSGRLENVERGPSHVLRARGCSWTFG